jgi:hypothetical protein
MKQQIIYRAANLTKTTAAFAVGSTILFPVDFYP